MTGGKDEAEVLLKSKFPALQLLAKVSLTLAKGVADEWMWVEIGTWQGERIRGLLANEPNDIPDLHAGAAVEISEQQVFDYLRYRADGTEEGNETGKEIAKAQRR